jgi:hypothetical protein
MPVGKRPRDIQAQALLVLAIAALCLLGCSRAAFIGEEQLKVFQEIHAVRLARKAEEHASELVTRLRGIKQSWTHKQSLERADKREQQSPPRFDFRAASSFSQQLRSQELRSQRLRILREYGPSSLVDPEPCDDQCQEQQRSSLMDLYAAWGGSGWRDNTGWGDPLVHHCSWFGVLCCAPNSSSLILAPEHDDALTCAPVVGPTPQNMPSVSSLKLGYNRLSGVLDPQLFAGLSATLQVLAMPENSMHGSVPPGLAVALPHLRGLALDVNLLTGTLPSEMSALPLTYLGLSFNNLSGSIPVSYSNLTQLQVINLRRNMLTGALLLLLLLLLWDHAQPHTHKVLEWFGARMSHASPRDEDEQTPPPPLLYAGSMPVQLVLMPAILSFLLGDNMMTGSIPDLKLNRIGEHQR